MTPLQANQHLPREMLLFSAGYENQLINQLRNNPKRLINVFIISCKPQFSLHQKRPDIVNKMIVEIRNLIRCKKLNDSLLHKVSFVCLDIFSSARRDTNEGLMQILALKLTKDNICTLFSIALHNESQEHWDLCLHFFKNELAITMYPNEGGKLKVDLNCDSFIDFELFLHILFILFNKMKSLQRENCVEINFNDSELDELNQLEIFLSKYGQYVKNLSLWGHRIDEEKAQKLIQKCPNLEHLRMRLALESLPKAVYNLNIKSISLFHCPNITEIDIRMFPALSELKYVGCPKLNLIWPINESDQMVAI